MSTKTKNLKLIKPDVTDEVTQTIKDLATNFDLLDALYPVGSIYQSTKPTDPGTFLGGVWSPINGVFLLAQSQKHPVGSTGGEEEHTLTVAEMPSHTHDLTRVLWHDRGDVGGSGKTGIIDWGDALATEATGGGKPHNNMPPYRSVFMWERTA